jgi:peptide/nickel transport system permease protein
MRTAVLICRRLGRTLLLLALVALGTILLMRFAPGYFSDTREMDAKYAQREQTALHEEEATAGTFHQLAASTFGGWLHGDSGTSRQYGIPVMELVRPRLRVTALLLVRGVVFGWLLALCTAFPASLWGKARAVVSVPFTVLLAIPTGAMATLCLLSDMGGPVLVLSLLLAARDFKFLQRLFSSAWSAPHLLQARAQGLRFDRLAAAHLLPNVAPQILGLATLSIVTALSAIVPIEVIFDVPGLGQLAWSAAINRDLPVLLTITLLLATAVSCAGMIAPRERMVQTA